MEKVKLDKFRVVVTATWTCPKCDTINNFEYDHGPYTAPAHDPCDEQCEKCKDFFTMNFYDD